MAVVPQLVGLKFLLEGGQWLATLLPENEALQILQHWQSGYYRAKDIPVIGETTALPAGVPPWAVAVDRIVAMHTFAPEEIQPAPAVQPVLQHPQALVQQPPPRGWGQGSGFPGLSLR